jgi:cephalosporin hydroxylase
MNIEEIVDKAFGLYMPQERDEIIQLAKFVHELQPKVIVEIGTKFGGTFMIWNEIATGIKISIDLIAGIHGGISRSAVTARNAKFKELYNDSCIFIEGNSHNKSTYDLLVQSLDGKAIDFLFIDGDHTYEGVKEDYETYSTLVSKNGYIGFHDINDTQHHRNLNVYVGKLWNELIGEKIEFNVNTNWAGIGVIKK